MKKPNVNKPLRGLLENYIEKRNSDLSDLFSRGRWGEMAAKFGADLILFSPEGEIIPPGQIAAFWEGVKNSGVNAVTFELVALSNHTLKLTKPPSNPQDKPHDIVAFEVSEYYYNDDESTGGSMKHGWRHRQSCPWG